MTAAAGPPRGSPASPGQAPGQGPGRPPESASFETARVATRRGRPPVVILGFFVVVAALVAVGIGGRTPVEPAGGPPVARDSAGASARATAAPSATPGPSRRSPGQSPDAAPIYTTGPGPIALVARRHPESIYVHGDVFVPRVTWVFVSLQDDAGRVAGWASVSVPGAAGPGSGDRPTLRFDVEVAVPDGYEGRLWIQANAYDADGAQVASSRLEVPPDGEVRPAPVRLSSPAGGDEVVTGGAVLVEGRLEIRATTVRIALQDDTGHLVASAVIDTANRDGTIRPVRAPTFRIELALPEPRPTGRLWVVVTAFDDAGAELGAVRRAVLLGALAS